MIHTYQHIFNYLKLIKSILNMEFHKAIREYIVNNVLMMMFNSYCTLYRR